MRAQLYRDQILHSGQVGGGGSRLLQDPGAQTLRHPHPVSSGRKPAAPSRPPPEPGPKQDAHLASREGKKNPQNRVPAQTPRLGPRVPIQTDRGRHPFMIRPLPVPTKLAPKPIGHFKQRWANPLLRTQTAAFDWSFRMDLKIKLSPLAVQAAETQDFFVVERRRSPRAFAEAGGSFEPLFLQKAEWDGWLGGCGLSETASGRVLSGENSYYCTYISTYLSNI